MKTLTTACVNHKGGVAEDHILIESGSRNCKVLWQKGLHYRCRSAGKYDDSDIRGRNCRPSQDSLLESVLQDCMQDKPLRLKPQKWLEKVDVIPTSLDLEAMEVVMNTAPGREFLFREIIKGLEEKYDHILIDCPPSLGIITQNALMASDFVIIPTDGNYFAMKGIEKIHYIISLLKRKLGAGVRILVTS